MKHIAAAVQMNSGADKAKNMATATRLVEHAARRGASLIVLPELFNCLAEPEVVLANAETIPGPTSWAMGQLAARLRVTLLAGSIAERVEQTQKVYNSSLLIGPDGQQLACYCKLHLFDIDLPGRVTFKESHFLAHGNRIVVTQTRLGRIGQATCYDLRFPELFRRLVDEGAELLVIPSAFTMATGQDHWEVLLRARAIENQMFVIGANQHGRHTPLLHTYGRSMIVDPWGIVLATASDGEGVALAEIDFERQADVRAHLPALQHRRPIHSLPAEEAPVAAEE